MFEHREERTDAELLAATGDGDRTALEALYVRHAPWLLVRLTPVYYGNDAMGAGSHGWHAVYLLGLCGLAALAALLRHPAHRRVLLVLGALVGIATLAAGLAQLP